MMDLFVDRLVVPIDQLFHPSGRLKRRGGFKHDAETLAVLPEGFDVVRHGLVFAPMFLVLGAVLQQDPMQLLQVIFRRRDGVIPVEDHVHRVGVATDLLLVAADKRFGPQPGE